MRWAYVDRLPVATYSYRMPTLGEINKLSRDQARELFARCCVAKDFTFAMVESMPFTIVETFEKASDRATRNLSREGLLQGFSGHPRIGDRKPHSIWSSAEQSDVTQSDEKVLHDLRDANIAYEKKFDYVFLICATGKSADFILSECLRRIENTPEIEIEEAREELRRINRLRIHKLLEEE